MSPTNTLTSSSSSPGQRLCFSGTGRHPSAHCRYLQPFQSQLLGRDGGSTQTGHATRRTGAVLTCPMAPAGRALGNSGSELHNSCREHAGISEGGKRVKVLPPPQRRAATAPARLREPGHSPMPFPIRLSHSVIPFPIPLSRSPLTVRARPCSPAPTAPADSNWPRAAPRRLPIGQRSAHPAFPLADTPVNHAMNSVPPRVQFAWRPLDGALVTSPRKMRD